MENDIRFAYITTENKEEARTIGRKLVEERLAACVNIVDGMESMFWWNGKVDSDSETILIAKTEAGLMPKLTDKVKEVHSYDCPAVLSIPVNAGEGNAEFIEWLRGEVAT